MRRLYNAVCAWLEADAQARLTEPEPQPEGAYSDAERDHRDQPVELHAERRYSQEDDEEFRAPRIGFTRTQHHEGTL